MHNNTKLYASPYNPKFCIRSEPSGAGENQQQEISGTAMLFNEKTVLFSIGDVEYCEIIDAHALDGCDMSDCVLTRNHSTDKLLARTKNNTLQLIVTEHGLDFKATIADTQDGRDTFKLIERGDLDACSFFAEIEEASYNVETHTRTILKFKRLNDVSAVTFPAYENTSVNAEMRSAYGFEEAELAAAKDKLEAAKKKVLLKF